MLNRKTLLPLLVALGATAAGALASLPADAAVSIWVNVAPPPVRMEVVPPPRVGFVWVPGYWAWEGERHVWRAGVWVRERPGYVYTRPGWVEHEGRWVFREGLWARADFDHDGVPNGWDRRPENPRRH